MSLQVKEHGIYECRDGKIRAVVGTDGHHTYPWNLDDGSSVTRNGFEVSSTCQQTRDLIREIVVGPGWLPWNGGENPAPGKVVEGIFRDGGFFDACPSLPWEWRHSPSGSDILAYRVVEQAAAPAPVVPARDPAERINELLTKNNDLLERARRAEGRAESLAAELAEKIDGANEAFDQFQAEVATRDRRIAELEARLAKFPAYAADSPPAFYMVHGRGCGGATRRHGNRDTAIAEAKRLAASQPGTPFAYLCAEGEFLVPVTEPVHRVFNPSVAAAASPTDDIPF